MSKVHVIHENSAWVEPLRQAFAELNTPFEEWFLDEGISTSARRRRRACSTTA